MNANLLDSVAGKTAQNMSSMLQDVNADRPTEIDYINGYIVKRGEELGVHTPLHEFLVRQVKSRCVFTEMDVNKLLAGYDAVKEENQ